MVPGSSAVESGYHSCVVAEMAEMPKRISTLLALCLIVTVAWAKDKTKNTLPAYVLQAHTVAVIIDPNAGFSMDGPQANMAAKRDVEAALLKWGRYEPVSEGQSADLIVVVRRGNGRLEDMASDTRQSNGTPVGPTRGAQSGLPNQPGLGPNQQQDPGSSMEMGNTEDSFTVFKGSDNPRDATPAWKYVTRDGLNPQTVPAVAAFKKAVTAADKAAAAAQTQKP
jgi:hypothetical protein